MPSHAAYNTASEQGTAYLRGHSMGEMSEKKHAVGIGLGYSKQMLQTSSEIKIAAKNAELPQIVK